MKKQVQEGGIPNTIIGVLTLVIAVQNTVNTYMFDMGVTTILLKVVPLYLLAFFIIIFKRKEITSIIVLIGAVYSVITASGIDDFSGSSFFIIAYGYYRKKWYLVFIVIITILSISIYSNINHLKFSTTINLFNIYIIIYILFYFLYEHKKRRLKLEGKDESRILYYLNEGNSQKEVAVIIGLDQSQVNYHIKNIRERNGDLTLNQVMCRYGETLS